MCHGGRLWGRAQRHWGGRQNKRRRWRRWRLLALLAPHQAGEAAYRAAQAALTAAYKAIARATARELSGTLGASLSPSQILAYGDGPTLVWEKTMTIDRRRTPRATEWGEAGQAGPT